MTIDDKIGKEKLQYDINREAAKILALSSRKIGKYEYHTGEEILPSNQRQKKEQAEFVHSPIGKAVERQTANQIDAIKSLKPSNKKNESKQIKNVFPQNLMDHLISEKLKKIINLQGIIHTDNLSYKSKSRKVYNFSEYYLLIAFLRDMHEEHLTLKDTDHEQKHFAAKINNLDKLQIIFNKKFR